MFMMGTCAVSWASKKQTMFALSTTEAEYIAVALGACQCFWLGRILHKIGVKDETGIEIMYNNNIQLSKHTVFHGKSKHIDVRFHFLRDLVNIGVVQHSFCHSQDQLVDIMMKPLKLEQFERL